MLAANRREEISGVWIQEGSDASRDVALLKAVEARGITPEYASKHDLNMLVGGDGLGTYIQDGLTRNGFPNAGNSVGVGIAFIVTLGIVLDTLLAVVQRVFTPRGLRI